MNLLARNVYALTREEMVSDTTTLSPSELTSLQQLANFQHSNPTHLADAWNNMAADYGWYPIINELEETVSEVE